VKRSHAAVLAVVIATALAPRSQARDLRGHLGLGGHVDGGPIGAALSLEYWVSDLGLQGLLGAATKVSTATEAGYIEYRPALRVLYAMTRARLTNLCAGVGLASVLRQSKEQGGNAAFFQVILGAQHFLGEAFSVAGEVAASIELGRSPTRGLLSGVWGASFHFYF